MGDHRARRVSGSARKSQVLSLRGKTQKLHEPPCDFNPISVVLQDLNECAIQPLEPHLPDDTTRDVESKYDRGAS